MTPSTRRRFLKTCAAASVAAPFLSTVARAFGAEAGDRPYRVGIVDWNTSHACDPAVFEETKALGYDGVQLSFQPEGAINLRETDVQKRFLDAATATGQQIASLAMGVLNNRPFATDADAPAWVSDCIDVMTGLNQDLVLVAFFGNGELKNKPDDQKAAVARFKELAPKAERLKKKLAIESYLDAEEHLRILDAIGSDAMTVYYDVANATKMGYDIFAEIELLGRHKVLSQVHMKELSARLGEGVIDFPKVRKTLDAADYRGWVVAESAITGDPNDAKRHNATYLKEVFG